MLRLPLVLVPTMRSVPCGGMIGPQLIEIIGIGLTTGMNAKMKEKERENGNDDGGNEKEKGIEDSLHLHNLARSVHA